MLNYITKHTVIGDPLDLKTTLGPIGYKLALERMRRDVLEAVNEHGAKIIYGDVNYKMTQPGFEHGYF